MIKWIANRAYESIRADFWDDESRKTVEKRIKKFKKMIEAGEMVDEFSRELFESVILRQRKSAACYIYLEKGPFEGYMEVLHFEDFYPHYQFKDTERMGRIKEMKFTRDISVGII